MARVGHEYEDSMGGYLGSGCPEWRASMQKESPFDQMNRDIAARKIAESNQAVVKSNERLENSNQGLATKVSQLNQRIMDLSREDEILDVTQMFVNHLAEKDPNVAEQFQSFLQENSVSKPKTKRK